MRAQAAAHAHRVEVNMASKIDILKEWVRLSNENPGSGSNDSYLADDFQNTDENGNLIMNREAYLGMGTILAKSFKDLKFVFSDMQENGNSVIGTFHIEGTQTGDLDLSTMGMGVIPASGKKIIWPESKSKFIFDGDKISGIQALNGGSMEWFLKSMGIKPPSGMA
jgi:hypothetical protein